MVDEDTDHPVFGPADVVFHLIDEAGMGCLHLVNGDAGTRSALVQTNCGSIVSFGQPFTTMGLAKEAIWALWVLENFHTGGDKL